MVGREIGSYRILSEIGAGGMGVVYLAEDSRLNRRVALKFIRADLDRRDNADARLVQEARAASALDHPNIATIYEIGEWQGGHFIAMAWYDGETLAERIARGPVPLIDAAAILEQVAEGLSRAHAAGIVHRDLKPGNIMLTRDGVVKILDFGLASYTSADAETVAKLTQTGSTLGTAAYMAPEQAAAGHADVRSDVWALGVIAYETLTGGRPFTGPHVGAVLHAIQYDTPAPLTGVPASIAALVMKALSRDPHQRPQSAAEFASVLHAWRASATERAPSGTLAVLRRPIVLVPVVLVLIAAGFYITSSLSRGRKIRWAREVALPEVARLVDAEQIVQAFDLATQASAILPRDAFATQLAVQVSATVPVHSEPAGATVSYQDYEHPEAGWRRLGEAPLSVTVPAAYLRWKFEKPGFNTVEVARSLGNVPALPKSTSIDVVMPASNASPPGMVLVPARDEPFRLFVPGFDHLSSFGPMGTYWIDRYEVTNADFKKFVDAGGYRRQEYWQEPFVVQGRTIPWSEGVARFVDSTGQPGPASWVQSDYPQAESALPVTGVSWYEAAAYAKFAGKQLPTMAHWADAAEPRASRWITQISNLAGKGLLPGGSRGTLHTSGAFDMAGNAKEWTSTDSGNGRRYILGGGWDDPPYAFNDPDARDPFERGRTFGFRCVRYVTPPDRAFTASIPFLTRDYRHEKPADAQLFEVYKRQYAYDPHPFNGSVSPGAQSTEDFRREDVTITTAAGNGIMRVYLFIPKKSAPPYQTVLFFPGANALRTADVSQLPRGQVDFLTKSGRLVVIPELMGMFARATTVGDSTASESNTYRDHFIAWVRDTRRTIDYLATRRDLAFDQLAYLGLSWGARMGSVIPSMEPRIKSQVLINGGLSLQPAQPEVDQINFVSRITIPTLMLNGRSDFYFPVESSQKPMFDLFATPAALKDWRLFNGGHNIPRAEMIKETLAWLDRFQPVTR